MLHGRMGRIGVFVSPHGNGRRCDGHVPLRRRPMVTNVARNRLTWMIDPILLLCGNERSFRLDIVILATKLIKMLSGQRSVALPTRPRPVRRDGILLQTGLGRRLVGFGLLGKAGAKRKGCRGTWGLIVLEATRRGKRRVTSRITRQTTRQVKRQRVEKRIRINQTWRKAEVKRTVTRHVIRRNTRQVICPRAGKRTENRRWTWERRRVTRQTTRQIT
jgi:hypothetical protein